MQRKDEDLFVIDSQPDHAVGHVPGQPSKRPRRTKEKKVTRAAAILAAGTQALPLGKGSAYMPRKKLPPQETRLSRKAAANVGYAAPPALSSINIDEKMPSTVTALPTLSRLENLNDTCLPQHGSTFAMLSLL